MAEMKRELKDAGKDVWQANADRDKAEAALSTLKARCEGMREAVKTHLDEASEVIYLLRIGADYETDTTIDCMGAVRLVDAFDAALTSLPVEGAVERVKP
jgi:hypothetical protein